MRSAHCRSAERFTRREIIEIGYSTMLGTGLAALARFRRLLGVFSFTYASLHLLAYGWLDPRIRRPSAT